MNLSTLDSITKTQNVTFGKFFACSDVQENIMARIEGGRRRADWEEDSRRRPVILPELVKAVESLITPAQKPFVIRVFARFNKHCGCSSCPCSPGFDIRLEVLPGEAHRFQNDGCHLHFYEHKDGSVEMRKEEKRWGRHGREKVLTDSAIVIPPTTPEAPCVEA